MASLIQKAASGDRNALTILYERNGQTVYCLSQALLREHQSAANACVWAMQSAIHAISTGEVRTESEFSKFALKQAAGYCKKEALHKELRAFQIPPQKDFHIGAIPAGDIGKYAGPRENDLNLLPTLQRFLFVLRYVGNLSVYDISSCIGLEPAILERAIDAEPENLSKIYRAVKAFGGQCTPPTAQMLRTAFQKSITAETIPDSVEKKMLEYINCRNTLNWKFNKSRMFQNFPKWFLPRILGPGTLSQSFLSIIWVFLTSGCLYR